MPANLQREIGGGDSKKQYTVSFVITDQMDDRLRKVLWDQRDLTRGKIMREALHKWLVWKEEASSEAIKDARVEQGFYGEGKYPIESIKVKKMTELQEFTQAAKKATAKEVEYKVSLEPPPLQRGVVPGLEDIDEGLEDLLGEQE